MSYLTSPQLPLTIAVTHFYSAGVTCFTIKAGSKILSFSSSSSLIPLLQKGDTRKGEKFQRHNNTHSDDYYYDYYACIAHLTKRGGEREK